MALPFTTAWYVAGSRAGNRSITASLYNWSTSWDATSSITHKLKSAAQHGALLVSANERSVRVYWRQRSVPTAPGVLMHCNEPGAARACHRNGHRRNPHQGRTFESSQCCRMACPRSAGLSEPDHPHTRVRVLPFDLPFRAMNQSRGKPLILQESCQEMPLKAIEWGKVNALGDKPGALKSAHS